MSETGSTPPPSGTESPSRFMMGVESEGEEDARFEQAVESFFGNRPNNETETGETETAETQTEDTQEGTKEGTKEGTQGEGTKDQPDNTQQIAGQGEPEGGEVEDATGEEGPDQTAQVDDFATLFEIRYGRPPTSVELEGLFSLADWANSLTPEQQQAIQAAYIGVQQTPTPAAQTPTPDPLQEEVADDPILGPLYTRIQTMQEQMEKMAQTSVQDQQTRVIHGLEQGASRFQDQYKVSDAELSALQGALGSARLLPGFVTSYGDPAEAMYRGLDYLYWNTPHFREREIQKKIEAQQAQEQQHTERKRKASSVTGTGGNGASRSEPPPKTPDGHWAALAQGLKEAMNNGQG